MTEIRGQVLGVADVRFGFDAFSGRAAQAVATAVEQQGIELQNTVRQVYLMGKSLNKRSGRLINSINTRFRGDGRTFTSTTGTALIYGRAWELGFLRNDLGERGGFVRSQTSRSVMGVREELKSRRGKIASGIAFVRPRAAHQGAEQYQPARPFLQPALEERRPSVTAALQAAVFGAI